jgi:hypothetical protein
VLRQFNASSTPTGGKLISKFIQTEETDFIATMMMGEDRISSTDTVMLLN